MLLNYKPHFFRRVFCVRPEVLRKTRLRVFLTINKNKTTNLIKVQRFDKEKEGNSGIGKVQGLVPIFFFSTIKIQVDLEAEE